MGWLFCAGDLRYTIGVIHIQIFLGMFFGKQLLDFLLHSRRAGAVDGAVGSVRAVGVDLWRSLVPLVLVSFVALLSLFVFAGQASAAVAKPSAIALTTPSSSPGNDTTPTFTVTVSETGGTVTLYSDSGCTTSNAISSATSVTDTDSPFTVAVTANTLSAGTYTVYAKHTEGGEDSPCSTETASYVLDTTAPTVDTTDTKYYSSVSVDNSGQSPTYVVTFSNANALGADSIRVTDQYIHARVKFSEDVKGAITNTPGTDRPSIWRVIGSAETQFEVEGQLAAGLEDPADTIGACAPADGENTPFVTDDWICTYRVKSTDLGKFKIRVKTTTTDAAGNALAQQYDHGTTIQLNKPAAPSAIVPTSDTGSSTSDKITKELTKVKVTLPTSASPTTSSTLQIFTYTPASDGSCATPTGSNDGWTSRGTTTGATATGGSPNYVTSTRVWTSNTFTQPSEGKYCFTAQYDIDGSGTSNVASSYAAGMLMELDTTAPTVTAADTKYYSSSTLTTENELASGSYRKQGQDIYTRVKFSENVSNTTANDTTARPSIWYLIGSNETQYDIVAHSATLADGDCKAKSSTDTSEYTCLYTTTSNVNGAFKVRVKTDTKDVAGTALGTQYDHGSTITLDTTAPTVTSADTKYYSNSNLSTELTNGSYRKSGESVYTKVKFSENVANTDANDTTARPSIWYLIGSNETQYDIVAHDATLADGDCKAKSSTDTNEYTCLYTTASNVNGAFKVRIKTDTQDRAANALSTQYDHSNTITLDTTAPTVTGTIATANENTVNSVKYLNANDTITLTLTLTENIQATNPIVQFKNGANNLGTPITTTGSGTTREAVFTVASGQNVSNGNLKWDITNESSVLDNAGNALVAVAAQDISNTVIDTTPPLAPTNLDLATADDSCADFDGTTGCDFGSNTDNRTSTTTGLSISYSGEEHATVQLSKSKDGGSAAEVGTRSSALASSGAGTTDIALSDGDGVYTVTAKQTDRALNISPASAALDITIDTTAPTAPPTPDLQAASDTGVSSTDNLTKDATVNFDLGSHTNTEECRYVYEGSNVTGQSTYACVAAADDAYTNTTEREESFKTRAYDAAGNHADSATALKVRFDRSITEALIDLKATSDSGYSTTDNITNVTEPTVALSQLESSADPTTGTGKAQVTINLWVDGDIDTVVDKTELTQVGAIANVSSTTQDLQLSALTEDIHKLVAVHTDDAGNEAITAVSKLAYNPADGTKGSNVIIVDTTAPEAPSKPDLSPNRDTYGANANPSRDGTNADDVTYHQDLLFFTEASKRNDGDSQDLTQAALIREQHHLLAYELTAADSSTATATSITGQNISGTTHSNPTNTAARTITSQQNYHSQTVAGQQHTHRFAGATPDTENQYHIATKQVDAAGNTSDYGPTLSLKIDRKAPNEAPGELILHFDSDTGISMTDRRTANTTPVFITEFPRTRQLEGENTDTDYQVDYYELWRAGLDSNYETEGAFAYPSDSTQNHQASFGLIPDTEDATDQLSDTTSSNPLLDVYEDGISVRIIQQNIPQYNKHYSYKMVSVDLAGNTTLGVDESNPEILVPPPTPSDPDLATASDTGSSTSDNLTKNTTLTLTTSYRNTSTAEQQGQAAQNLRTLELTITPPNNGDPQTLLFSRPADHNDGDGFDIPTGERRDAEGVPDPTHTTFTATYSFSTAVDLTQVFGDDLQDGTYTLSFLGINSQGERGLPSNELTVTLDTTPPAFGDNLTLTSTRVYEQSSGANTKHRFEIAATPDTEEGTVVTFHYGTTNTAVLTVTNNIGRTASNASFAEVAITTHSLAEDYTDYEVSLIDAAGNSVPRFAYPDNAKAPRFLSFDTGETNTYILSAYPRNDGTITEPYSATTASGGTCQTTTTSTTYTPRSKVTVASATTDACAVAVDSYGNRTIVNISAEKTDLITAAGIHPDDDSTEQGDNLTNNPNPRYHGTTIPGASVRFQTKRSADDWTDAYEQTVTAEDDGSFTIPRILSTPAGGQRESIFTTTVTTGDATGDADPVHGYFSVERSNVGSIVARQAGSASQTSFTHNGFSLELKGVGFRDTAGSSDYFGFCVVADNSKLSIAGLNNVKLFKVFPDPLSIVFRDSDHTITLPLVRDALNSDFTVNAALFGIDLAGEEDPCLVFFSGGSSSLTSSIALLRQHFFTNEGTTFTFSIEPMASGMKTSVDVRAYLTHTDVLGAAELTTPIDLSPLTLDVTPPAISAALKEPTSSPAADTTPTLTITAEESATVGLYSDAQCSVQVGSSATVAAGESTADLTTAALTDGEYAFYAQGTDVAGNPACTQSALDYTLDTVAPDVTVIQVGTGDTAQYVATAADATTTTARHKDTTPSAVCTVTAGLETDGTLSSGWTAYTGTLVKSNGDNAGSISGSGGMCIIFTDAAGNSTAQHIVDGGTYTNSIGGFTISDDTGVLSDDFITNNPSQTLSAVTVPGSEGSLILTNKTDTNQVITLPFTASHYSATQPSRFSVSTTIPEGTYTVTAEVTIDGTPVTAIPLQDPLIVDTTAPSAPETANPYSLTSSNDTFKVDGVVRAGFTYVSASIGVASAPYSVGSTTQHFLTLFGTDYPCTYSTSQANSGVNESDTFTCSINYTVDATTPQGVAALTMRGEDVAGNAYSFTISDDDAVVYTVDTLAPEYTVTASKTAAKPGDTVTVTVDADDLHDVLLNGSAVSDDNQMRVSFAGEQFSLSTLPGSFDYTVPTDALDGQRTISLPQITDRVGNAAAPTPQGVLFVDTKTPSVSRYLFSNSGTTLSVSAQVARNNHSSMPGEEGVTLSFTGSCSSFPASPVFTASAQAAPERYAYSIRIPRGTYTADTCSLIARDAVGNQSDPTLTTIPLTITASRSGGGSSGGGGGVGVIKYNVSRGGPPLPEQVGIPLPPEPRAEEVSAAIQSTLTRNLTIGSQGNDVQQLQRYLNNNTCPVAQTGAGSPGQESTYFGQKTQQAVICYQQKHSITPPQGYVGPKTRAHINARISPHPAAPQGIPLTIDSTLPPQTKVTPRNRQAPSFTPTITPQQQPHSLGDRHPDIKEAQELLNERTSCPVAATGPGSPGQETTYFGSLTRQAILCYQRANTLTPTGTLSPSLLSTLRQEPLPQRQQQEEAQDTPQNTNYQPINDPYIYTQRTRRSYTAPSL